MTTPTYTKEEWDSRKITYCGFSVALFDILLMGIYQLGGMGFLHASSYVDSLYLQWGYLAIGVFLMINVIGKLSHLFNPRDWYEVEIVRMGEVKCPIK